MHPVSAEDARIKVVSNETPLQISDNTNKSVLLQNRSFPARIHDPSYTAEPRLKISAHIQSWSFSAAEVLCYPEDEFFSNVHTN